MFGIASYNTQADTWEVTKPIALMKEGTKKILSHFTWEQVGSYCGIIFRGVFAYFCLIGALWATKRILFRIRNGIRGLIRAAFNRQDEANQLPDGPRIERDGIDRIDIESYTCTSCNREPRNIIFKPCKHCYLCRDCYA